MQKSANAKKKSTPPPVVAVVTNMSYVFTFLQVNILLAIFTFNFATVILNVATWILAVYVFLVVAAHKLEIEQGEEDSRYGIIIQRVLVF